MICVCLFFFSVFLFFLFARHLDTLFIAFLPACAYLSSFTFVFHQCCEDLDSNSFLFCLILKMFFSLPQLFVLFDVLGVAVFVIRDRFVNKM